MLPTIKPVISVKEARKILGKTAQLMNDSQIADLVNTLTSMGADFLENLGSTNYNG